MMDTRSLVRAVTNLLHRRPLNSSTEIKITRLCTQRCRQCSIHERRTQPTAMSLEEFKLISFRLRDYGAYIGFISGGEPTLVPYLGEILLEAKRTFPLATTLVTGLYNKTPLIQRMAQIALDNNIHIQTSLDGLGELGDHLRGVKDHARVVLDHMKLISRLRGDSKSLLYVNIVINNLNLEQVPELIRRARDLGWKATISIYHTLTSTTKLDREMVLKPGKRLDRLLSFLSGNSDILNLDSFIKGIGRFVSGFKPGFCPFVDSPVLSTRLTIMENGDIYLCKGETIGNLLHQGLKEVFQGQRYHQRLKEYRRCPGCWSTCYTQRYLLIHPRSLDELTHNIKTLTSLRSG